MGHGVGCTGAVCCCGHETRFADVGPVIVEDEPKNEGDDAQCVVTFCETIPAMRILTK